MVLNSNLFVSLVHDAFLLKISAQIYSERGANVFARGRDFLLFQVYIRTANLMDRKMSRLDDIILSKKNL